MYKSYCQRNFFWFQNNEIHILRYTWNIIEYSKKMHSGKTRNSNISSIYIRYIGKTITWYALSKRVIFHKLQHLVCHVFRTLPYPVCFRSAFYPHFRMIQFNKHLTKNMYQLRGHPNTAIYQQFINKPLQYINPRFHKKWDKLINLCS